MALDIELYRRIIHAPAAGHSQTLRRISVIDIHPEEATRTLLFIHGYGGSATQWLHQLCFFGQTMHVIAPDLRGHGLSDDPVGLPHTMDGLVNDLDMVLDALHVRGPVHFISQVTCPKMFRSPSSFCMICSAMPPGTSLIVPPSSSLRRRSVTASWPS